MNIESMHPADIVEKVEITVSVRGHGESVVGFLRPYKIRQLLDDDETTIGGFLREVVCQVLDRQGEPNGGD